jgi:hypothetical protein
MLKKGGVSSENPSYLFPLLFNQRIQILRDIDFYFLGAM